MFTAVGLIFSSFVAPPAGGDPPAKAHTDNIYAVAFRPDGRQFATASGDHTARVWDAAPLTPRATLRHPGPVYDAAWSPDGKVLTTAAADKAVRVWDPASGTLLRTLTGHTGPVYGAAVSPDGDRKSVV